MTCREHAQTPWSCSWSQICTEASVLKDAQKYAQDSPSIWLLHNSMPCSGPSHTTHQPQTMIRSSWYTRDETVTCSPLKDPPLTESLATITVELYIGCSELLKSSTLHSHNHQRMTAKFQNLRPFVTTSTSSLATQVYSGRLPPLPTIAVKPLSTDHLCP